jgi:hypothetical protein
MIGTKDQETRVWTQAGQVRSDGGAPGRVTEMRLSLHLHPSSVKLTNQERTIAVSSNRNGRYQDVGCSVSAPRPMHPLLREYWSTKSAEPQGVLLLMTKQLTRSVGYRWLEADSLGRNQLSSLLSAACLQLSMCGLDELRPCENQTMPEGFSYDFLCLQSGYIA